MDGAMSRYFKAHISNESCIEMYYSPRELLFRCPSLRAAEYEVTVLNSVSALIAGCAYITYSSSILIQQSYLMWFGSKEEKGQDCYNPNLEYFRYNCLTKDLVLNKDTIEGLMYLRLYADDYNKTGTPDYKCALYETINGNRTHFRFAISPNKTCKGLIDVLYPPRDMLFSDSNPGAVLLSFNSKNFEPRLRKVSTTCLTLKYDGNGGNGSVTNTTTTNITKN
ncbi:uncharacterized protein LOC126552523 [Aphis gossypii]|uniref:uncharacterized protein LOC126552523 n=1 Tax=Aphis gossypii TaxID=80765 RepID=UPI002158CF81|nr:uncharacterized protein LOC126552523 [Aphis gossypii]